MKDEIFSKLNIKNYNNELEKILEKKYFSEDAKNLLLSMFYRVETAYNDYAEVKRNVINKNEFLEYMLKIISRCNDIEIIKPRTDKFKTFLDKNIKFKIDYKKNTIEVLQNEKNLLSAILELNNFQIYLKEDYNLVRNSLPGILNEGKDINNVEIIRDFNAWTWNILYSEIENIDINLIYQNLQILLNYNFLTDFVNSNTETDFVKYLKIKLADLYGEEFGNQILTLLFKLSIIIYIKSNPNEAKRLNDERENLKKDFDKINNKKTYIKNLMIQKKNLSDQVKHIDILLNDRTLLEEEFKRRNETLSDYNKIFSLKHLSEKLLNERKIAIIKIEECNSALNPENYIKEKTKLEDNINLIDDINFEKIDKNNINKYKEEFQKVFLECFKSNVMKVSNKRELIELLYEFRYYEHIPYNDGEDIKKVKQLNNDINEIEKLLISKMNDLKIINNICDNKNLNFDIIKNIFDLKIISLENVFFEIKIKDELIILNIYDEKETLDTTVNIKYKKSKETKIKSMKKFKLIK